MDNRELLTIDDLMSKCGYGYCDESNVNNGYNCSHSGCEESEYTKYDEVVDINELIRKYIINKVVGRKKRIRNKIIKKYWTKRTEYDYWKQKLGLKEVGKCYTFSCPIAYTAGIDDLKELDSNLYEEYKDSADSEGNIESDWVIYLSLRL